MRIIRVEHGGTSYYGILEDGLVFRLHQQPGHMEPIPLSEAKVLPLVTPSKVVCVGLNYKAHAEELGYPLPNMPSFFLKPPSSIIGNGEPIVLPSGMGRIEHEAELADYRAAKAAMNEPQPDAGGGGGKPVRVHLCQRCDGPRGTEGRSAHRPLQVLRYVLSHRPVD